MCLHYDNVACLSFPDQLVHMQRKDEFILGTRAEDICLSALVKGLVGHQAKKLIVLQTNGF